MSEHDEQKALIDWCDCMGEPYSKIYAIPNGGHRHKAIAGKLKAEGVRPGVPDLKLPIPNDRYHGLYIELKTKQGRVTDRQAHRIAQLNEDGYLAVACHGWDAARKLITDYVKTYSRKSTNV